MEVAVSESLSFPLLAIQVFYFGLYLLWFLALNVRVLKLSKGLAVGLGLCVSTWLWNAVGVHLEWSF